MLERLSRLKGDLRTTAHLSWTTGEVIGSENCSKRPLRPVMYRRQGTEAPPLQFGPCLRYRQPNTLVLRWRNMARNWSEPIYHIVALAEAGRLALNDSACPAHLSASSARYLAVHS